MEMTIELEGFVGPLDLLLHLLEKNKVNIYDIPIALITNQYMDYLNELKKYDLNNMSEFLVMAATLLDIKTKMLLPKEVDENNEEIDPRAQLVEQLLQYKMYKYMAFQLKERQEEAGFLFYKKPTIPSEVGKYKPPLNLEKLTEDVTLEKLHEIFQSLIKKQEDKIDKVRSNFGKIEKEEISLEEKMQSLYMHAKKNKNFSFRQLLSKQSSKLEMIVTFLSILELMKTGDITIKQDKIFDDIQIISNIQKD